MGKVNKYLLKPLFRLLNRLHRLSGSRYQKSIRNKLPMSCVMYNHKTNLSLRPEPNTETTATKQQVYQFEEDIQWFGTASPVAQQNESGAF